jgi:hypothetical protein
MADPAQSSDQNLLPVQAYFAVDGTFQTFIGQGQPFYATVNPSQSGLNITNSTINSTTIGATTPSTGVFTNIATTTGTISTLPSANNDIANKQYVDAYVAGIAWKPPVNYGTTADITLSGLGTQAGGEWLASLTAGMRILVKNQLAAANNGIYVVSSGPWARSADANTWDELVSAVVFIETGATLGGTAWYCPAQPGGTLGVTAINWSYFSVNALYSAGTGLTLNNYVFSITNTGVTAATYGSASSVPVFAVNAQGQLTSVTDTSIAISASQITSGTIDTARISGSYTGITGVGTLTAGTWNANTIGVGYGGTGATTFTAGYLKASGTTAFTTVATIPSSDITGLGTMSTQNANSVAITGGSAALNTLKTLGLTGYLYGNDTSAVTASTTIPNTAITGLGTMSTQNANSVAITGGTATGLTNLGADYLQLNVSAGATYAYGKLYWNNTGGLSVGLDGGASLVMPVGEVVYTYGKASSAISIGQVIIKTGVVGASGVIQFGPSTAGLTDGNAIVGIACEPIASGSFGRVVVQGVVRGFNLSAYNNNDTLWYDPAGGGALTATKPSAPNLKAEVGIVINNGSGGSGSMYVSLFPGSQLGGTDQNVQITGIPSDGSLLQYDSALQYWKNVASSTVSVGTATNLAGGGAGYVPYQSGAGATSFVAAGTSGQVLTSNGSSAPTWTTPTAYATVTDDTTTNATRYPLFASVTAGNLTTEYVSSTKLQFNPSTGILTATSFTGAGTGLTGTASGLSIGGTALNVTGTVAVANGGTGVTTLTGLAYGNGTAAFSAATAAQVVAVIGTTAVTNATNAVNVGVTDDTTTATSVYPAWVSTTTGNLPVKTASTKLSFVPSTGVLSATSFSGAGTGLTGTASSLSIGGNAATATSATSATTATSATNTAITDDTTTNATVYPTWVTANTGNLPQKVSSTKLSFNPSTGALTVSNKLIIAP